KGRIRRRNLPPGWPFRRWSGRFIQKRRNRGLILLSGVTKRLNECRAIAQGPPLSEPNQPDFVATRFVFAADPGGCWRAGAVPRRAAGGVGAGPARCAL